MQESFDQHGTQTHNPKVKSLVAYRETESRWYFPKCCDAGLNQKRFQMPILWKMHIQIQMFMLMFKNAD